MTDQASQISVSLDDLTIIRAAVNSAANAFAAMDLVEQYRKLSVRPQASAMTKALDGALVILDELLGTEEEDESDS